MTSEKHCQSDAINASVSNLKKFMSFYASYICMCVYVYIYMYI